MRRKDEPEQLDERDEALIRQLRALPDDGNEPDWGALERSIRDAVGPDVPRPWWRRWRWLIPVAGLAAVTAGALLWLHRPVAEQPLGSPPQARIEQVVPVVSPVAAPVAAPASALWLGGNVVELDDPATSLPDALDREAQAAIGPDEGDGSSTGFLPATDLGWVDALDDSALDRAETWLAGKKG